LESADVTNESLTEVEQLRRRVAELERRLADQAERANRAVAAAQDKAYWLDRYHVDLNAIMKHRSAQRAVAVAGVFRRALRRARRLLR
jgi:cell division septum initiation protein DivIVA